MRKGEGEGEGDVHLRALVRDRGDSDVISPADLQAWITIIQTVDCSPISINNAAHVTRYKEGTDLKG
jgi:hypothetical protein